jgi:hypothetical protein
LTRRALAVGFAWALGAALTARPWALARAQDAFEIQVYDGTADAPGAPGLELHLNDWLTGHREPAPPEVPLHGQLHATLEPSLGLFPFWEIGAYLQFAEREDDGVFGWAGVKLRSKFVTPPTFSPHLRLGVNLEVSYLPAAYEASRWGSEIRPIVAWQDERWLFAFNPIVDQSFAPPDGRRGPFFEPAVKASRSVGPVALGFEYYGSIGPIASPSPAREQVHYLFEVVDVIAVEHVELNVGLGEGLTPVSAGLVLKAIVGYEFDPVATRPEPEASNVPRHSP